MDEVKTELKLKLDLGCGQNKREGFVGVDICNISGVDVVHNLESFPWPFENESVEEVFSSHYLEHVDNLFGFMNELYRVMRSGAKALFICPYGNSDRAWQDPTHKRPITSKSFLYYSRTWREESKLTHYPVNPEVDFLCQYGHVISAGWRNRSQEAIAYGLEDRWNVADDIHVTLTKLVR